jgi:glucose-6-phosphate isomerase
MHKLCLEEKDPSKNPAVISAAITHYYAKKKVNISNTFVFGKNLEFLGRWYRQLLAESLGKELDLDGKKVNRGITPIVSLGTEDLHSMEQLCIAGPYDKITTFVYPEKQLYSLSVPLVSSTGLAKYMEGYELNNMMHFIVDGVREAFTSKKRPFISVKLGEVSESTIGEFMMWKMYETVYLAHLMNLNPFDQPGVESYKKATREFMSKNVPLIK